MSVDLRKVKKLIELVEESGISELEVRDGEETIRIARQLGHSPVVVAPGLAGTPDHTAPRHPGSPKPPSASQSSKFCGSILWPVDFW